VPHPVLGDDTEWAFAIWQASSDSYTDAVLLDGHRTGHPNQALDTACTLYLASPGDEPAEPLKDLRGAALVILAGLREWDDKMSPLGMRACSCAFSWMSRCVQPSVGASVGALNGPWD
jgi:hypothetical protein